MQTEIAELRQDIQELRQALNLQRKNEFLTVTDVVDLTGLSRHTIYKYTQHQRIPYFKVGNLLRFRRDEIYAWMDEKRVELA